ncbi:MAG: 3-deoxy-7-phosphoheptulonate synthase [Helicobacter sp.]|nr:3-deoxy-7-phosphoheptulonate synthase [Helicobacter sp.]
MPKILAQNDEREGLLDGLLNAWKSMPICQHPVYDDLKALDQVENRLLKSKALVDPHEILQLKRILKDIKAKNGFILQAGECAESFDDFSQNYVWQILDLIDKMSEMLPVSVKIARLAGQFAKPRSEDFERIDNKLIPSYRGDIINSIDPTKRNARPSRMIKAYNQSQKTLNFMRDFSRQKGISEMEYFSSHEALLLHYESALLRIHERSIFDTSAHMLWLGERTRKLDYAHVEFLKNIANPIGIKVSHKSSADEIMRLCELLNPSNEIGKIILINRMGAAQIDNSYPKILKDLAKQKKLLDTLLFICDPMHGNTLRSSCGKKTRFFDDIKSELKSFFAIHNDLGISAHGIHIEISGSSVTECIGCGISELSSYETKCDPRLNPTQSLEIAKIVKAMV